MALKASKIIADRMKNMLTRDKIGVGQGFMLAFKGDVTRLLADYFLFDGEVATSVEPTDEGGYEVKISLEAKNLKAFSTTVAK